LLGWWLLKGGLHAWLHFKAEENEGIKGSCLVQKRKGKNGRGIELSRGWETKGEELEVYLLM
jgi:hypothetical protein